MGASFLSLPDTAWIQIASLLDRLEDVRSYIQTCTTLRSLVHLRSFWAPILLRTIQSKAINYPTFQNLWDASPSQLYEMFMQRRTLDANWSLPTPKIMGQVKCIKTHTDDSDLVILVPGTDIIAVHKPMDRKIVCYDTQSGSRTLHVDLPLGWSLDDVSAPLESPGKFVIAVRASE